MLHLLQSGLAQRRRFPNDVCRIKKELSSKDSAAKKNTPTAAKTSGEGTVSDAKPKQRRSTGMDKTEKDVHHVLYKVIGQVNPQLLLVMPVLAVLAFHSFSAEWVLLSITTQKQTC